MRRLMLVVAIACVFVVSAALLAGCGGGDDTSALADMPARTINAGDVEVKVIPTRLDADGAAFEIAFDTHSGSLDVDVAETATLTIAGDEWTGAEWSGDGAGGHHREGTLEFVPGGPSKGDVTLTIQGLDEPVVAEWKR